MNRHSHRRKKISARVMALSMAAAMAVTVYPVPAFAEEGQNVAQKVQVLDKTGGNIHDYGKTGDDPATPDVDESAIVANSDVLRSAQYQESTKYELKVNGTPVSVYKYQKQTDPGSHYHMDIARFSSDDAEPVFEITMKDGSTIDRAITVSLLEDGTFFAKFDDYEITAEDSFIDRPDSEAIGAAPVIEDNYKEADPNEPEQIVIPNSITFSGTIIDNVIESLVPIILVDVEENSGLSYDKVLFELTEEQKDWELKIGTRVQIVCSDIFQESTPPIGNLISITEAAPNDELKIADEAARAYYENTVFEVVFLELKSQTENESSFSVCVSKGGIVQEPDRTIFLEFVNGHWEVVNEGY